MPLADVYQLIHKQSFGTTNIENVYFYERGASDVSHADLLSAFVSSMLPKIIAIQSTAVKTIEVTAASLGNLADYGEHIATGVQGLYSGDALPVFNALSYTLRPDTRAVRPGSKRIAGVPEVVTNYNDITDADYIAKMETLRVQMDTPIGAGPTLFSMVIVKRIKTPVEDTMPQQYKYALPKAGDPLVLANLGGVLVKRTVSHQVSRKD